MGLPVVGKAHEAQAGAAFRWFIYGSSLDVEAFRAWAAEHGYQVPDFSRAQAARLDGWRLQFDVRSRFWGGAVASLHEAAGAHVEGIVLPLGGEARGLVDHKEGAISGLYRPFAVEVTPLAGGAPLAAVAYRAADDRRLPSEETPSRAFIETLVRGARAFNLSPEWIARLQSL
jgi:gamma-glutamylcyclotransferase